MRSATGDRVRDTAQPGEKHAQTDLRGGKGQGARVYSTRLQPGFFRDLLPQEPITRDDAEARQKEKQWTHCGAPKVLV